MTFREARVARALGSYVLARVDVERDADEATRLAYRGGEGVPSFTILSSDLAQSRHFASAVDPGAFLRALEKAESGPEDPCPRLVPARR